MSIAGKGAITSREGTSPSMLVPVRQLIALARRRHAAALPPETHQSHPIPALLDGKLRMVFLYCPLSHGPEGTARLLAPSYRAILHPDSGELESLKAVEPGQLGQSHRPDAMLGPLERPGNATPEQLQALEGRFYQAYDVLVPAFAAGGDTPRTAAILGNAADFKRLFDALSERPLAPYYQRVGQGFFHWLNRVSRSP